jgi:hypothetical protein
MVDARDAILHNYKRLVRKNNMPIRNELSIEDETDISLLTENILFEQSPPPYAQSLLNKASRFLLWKNPEV